MGVRGAAIMVPAKMLRTNTWNPNRMDREMLEKERASIQEFGFVDPITVRILSVRDDSVGKPDMYEIIDGEHRYKVGLEEGITEFPCWSLGFLPDEEAMQLTVILNETRGQADPQRLSQLMRDLASKVALPRLQEVMPYSPERLADLTGLREQAQASFNTMRDRAKSRMVERVYRLPQEVAEQFDDALDKARHEGAVSDAEAIAKIAQGYLDS